MHMNIVQIKLNKSFVQPLLICLLALCSIHIPLKSAAQNDSTTVLEKMPEDLETDFALSALPPHLRNSATVYLLDPTKGYYVARAGTNGFVCFISRTEWEWGEFRKDLAVPMSYDAEGAKTVFIVYKDVAAMRASGKFTALQIRDTVVQRIKNGFYKAPSKGGISYMLAPVMRAYEADPDDKKIISISVPHYMFYAPYTTDADIGITPDSEQEFILGNPGNYVLGKGKGPFGIVIFPVSHEHKLKIVADEDALLKRLVAYKSYFAVKAGAAHHH